MQVKPFGDISKLNKENFLPEKSNDGRFTNIRFINPMVTYPNAHYRDLVEPTLHFGSSNVIDTAPKTTRKKRRILALDFPTVAAYKGYRLDRYQRTAVDSLKEGHDVIVSAPTGTGKTLIAEEIILYNLRHGKQTFYTAPLKALVDDKFDEFKKEFGKDKVARLTGDYKTENALKYPVVVMTTEVYRNMVLNQVARNTKSSPRTAIFDEIHSMGDLERGTVWEESIMASPHNTQILGLSATVSNANKITKWLERIHTPKGKKAILVSVPREKRHVPLHYFAYNPDTPGKLFDLEQDGISQEIFTNSTTTNEKLSPRQIEALDELTEIYNHNPVIQGRKVLNRIRSKDCPKTEGEFSAIVNDLAKKAGVDISPEDTKSITSALVANNKSAESVITSAVRNYRLIDFTTLSDLTAEQRTTIENLGLIAESLDKKGKLQKKIIPVAYSFLTNIEGVNNQRYNYDYVVNNIKNRLKLLAIPDAEALAERIAAPFKARKPNALIGFIKSISINKEDGILFENDAEKIISKKLMDTLRKQGLSERDAEVRAAACTEQIRKAFCSVYDNPKIDTISKAVRYSSSQYVTKHLIKVPHSKNIPAHTLEQIKNALSPEQVKMLSLFGFILNSKAVDGITRVQDIEKQVANNNNFLKGIKFLSLYSKQKIKTKEEFIEQIITPRFNKFRTNIQQRIKDGLAKAKSQSEIQIYKELQQYMDAEFSDKKVSGNSRMVMDAILTKQPGKVINTREILTKLIVSEEARESHYTSPERFMFKLSRRHRGNTTKQTAQLRELGSALIYKQIDKGMFVFNRLKKTSKFSTTEHLKKALKKIMKDLHIPDVDEKLENIVKYLTIPLTEEEISRTRAEIISKQVKGKIDLKVGEIKKTTGEQARALQKLALLYEYLDSAHPFKSKSPNNGMINLMHLTTTGQDTEAFKKDLEELLISIQEPMPKQKAASIAKRLQSKIPNKGLETSLSTMPVSAGRRTDYMPDLIATLNKAKILPGLFFIPSRRRCGETLKACTQDTTADLLTPEEKVRANEIIEEHMRRGELLDTKFEHIRTLLLRGYAVHHAGKMPAYKALVQDLANEGLSKATFATDTLAAGINYPVKASVITSLHQPEGTTAGGITLRLSKATEVQQKTGRAGRRGRDTEGYGIFVIRNADELHTAVDLAERMPEPVESHYRPSYGLVANLLMSNPSLQNLDAHFSKSFLVEECADADGKEQIVHQLKSRTDDIACIMLDKGYLEKIDDYGRYRVTAKGQIASMIKGVNELFLTELVTNPNLLDIENIDSSMFAGIVSSMTYDSSSIHQKLKNNSTRPIIDAYTAAPQAMRAVLDNGLSVKLAEIIKKEREIEDRNPLLSGTPNTSLKRSFISFNKWMAPFVYQWARCPKTSNMTEFWEEITGVMKDGELLKDSADFTRTISNTVDVLTQIENIIGYIDDKDLYIELNLDPIKLDRMKGLTKKALKEISKIRLH